MISTADLFDTSSRKIFRPILLVLVSGPELRLGLLYGSPTTCHANAGASTACSKPVPGFGAGHWSLSGALGKLRMSVQAII